MRKPTFKFNNTEYTYLDHEYNSASNNSRSIEVPIGLHFMSAFNQANCIEVGNVISHYDDNAWRAVDMREGPIKADMMQWKPKHRLDAILTISTLEHVGHGRYAGTGVADPQAVVRHLTSWLKIGGKMLITVPIGYNTLWDEAIRAGVVGTKRFFMVRQNDDNEWKQCGAAAAFSIDPRKWKWGSVCAIIRVDNGA